MKARALYILLLISCLNVHGQADLCEKTWKKEVSRIIYIKSINEQLHSPNNKEQTLLGIITAAVKAGKINACNAGANQLTQEMTIPEFRYIVDPHIDTVSVIDPVNQQTTILYAKEGLNADSIYTFKIVEDWAFNPAEGKINIQIVYIAPVEEMHGDDYVYRGSKSLFRISYKDFVSVMKVHNEKELDTFSNYIWKSYFADDSGTAVTSWNADATMQIDMSEPDDTLPHFLKNEYEDTPLSQLIYNAAAQGEIPSWSSNTAAFIVKQSKEDLVKQQKIKTDTSEVIDPVSRTVITRTTDYNINYQYVHHYKILENWSLNTNEGKTEINIKEIGPQCDFNVYSLRNPLFWVKYKDIQPVLERIEQYTPEHTLAMHIWDQFFLSDTKPVLVK